MDFNFPHGPQKIEILKNLNPLYVKSHQEKFPLKRLRNGRVMACNVISTQSIEKWLIEILQVRLEILQRCMEYCSAAGSMFRI